MFNDSLKIYNPYTDGIMKQNLEIHNTNWKF